MKEICKVSECAFYCNTTYNVLGSSLGLPFTITEKRAANISEKKIDPFFNIAWVSSMCSTINNGCPAVKPE